MSHSKPTPTEQARLDEIVRRLTFQGYRANQIGEACGGFSDSAIGKRRRKLGLPSARSITSEPPQFPPPRQRWRDSEFQPRIAPTYQDSTTVQLCRSWLNTLSQDNAVNRLAYDVADATREHDTHWLAESRAVIIDVQGYLYRLLAVIDSEELRRAAMTDPMQRDDVPRALRLIHRSS